MTPSELGASNAECEFSKARKALKDAQLSIKKESCEFLKPARLLNHKTKSYPSAVAKGGYDIEMQGNL